MRSISCKRGPTETTITFSSFGGHPLLGSLLSCVEVVEKELTCFRQMTLARHDIL